LEVFTRILSIIILCAGLQTSLSIRLPKHSEEDGFDGGEGIPLRRQESMRST